MTSYEPNSAIRPTGMEPGEFIDAPADLDDDEEERGDPSARPTGSPPVEPDPSDERP